MFRSKPLQIWDRNVRNGHIKRLTDSDIQSSVLEIMGTNVSTNFITCPIDNNKTLAIKLPFLVMIIKNVSIPLSWQLCLPFLLLATWGIKYLPCVFCMCLVEEIFHIWGVGVGWQERSPSFQSLQLSVHHPCQALHLHHAHETWWGLEPDPVQLVWFH